MPSGPLLLPTKLSVMVAHHKIRYKLFCTNLLLNVCAIFSNIQDFAVYVCTMTVACPLATQFALGRIKLYAMV